MHSISKSFHSEYFQNFMKLIPEQQATILRAKGLLLDRDEEKHFSTNLYFLNGFFVEEIVATQSDELLFVLPFKHGYKIESFPEIKSYLDSRIIGKN